MDKIIMKADAESIVGSLLADELEEDHKKRLKEKGDLEDGMVYKGGEEKGTEMEIEVGFRPYGGATSMAAARQYLAAEERLERMGEQYRLVRGCLENIWNSGASMDEIARQTVKLFQEAAQYILGGK